MPARSSANRVPAALQCPDLTSSHGRENLTFAGQWPSGEGSHACGFFHMPTRVSHPVSHRGSCRWMTFSPPGRSPWSSSAACWSGPASGHTARARRARDAGAGAAGQRTSPTTGAAVAVAGVSGSGQSAGSTRCGATRIAPGKESDAMKDDTCGRCGGDGYRDGEECPECCGSGKA
jgi:hypothetical protein